MWWLAIIFALASCGKQTLNDFFGGINLIPAILGDAPSGAVLYNLRVSVGMPPSPRRFVADFSSSQLILNYPPQLIPDAVLVRVGNHRMMMDYSIDPNAAAQRGCPDCDGVFPLGAGSPIWMIYRNATVTSGGIYLDNRFEADHHIPCRAPVSEFCIASATILGFPTDVYFVPNQAETVLPGRIFRAYEEDRDIGSTPWYEWNDLTIEFAEGNLVIPRDIIYQKAFGESPRRMVEMAPSGQNYTIIGTTALRAFEMQRDWNKHTIAIREWRTSRTYGIPSLLAMLLLILAFFRWLESPPLFRVTPTLIHDNPIQIGYDLVLEICVLFFPVALLLMEGTYYILFSEVYLSVVTGVMAVFVFGWGVFVQIMFWGNAPERIAFLTNERKPASQARFEIDSRSEALPLYMNVGIIRQREIREYTYEISILLSIFFIALEGRQDVLGTFISVLVYIGFLMVTTYHFVSSMRISRDFPSVVWFLFLFSSFVVNIFFVFGMHVSVFVTGLRKYFPRDDSDLLMVNVIFHVVFIMIVIEYSLKKSRTSLAYASQNSQHRKFD